MMSPQVVFMDERKAKRIVQRIPQYNPIKGFGNKSNIHKTDGLSEYQAAYRKWPFQSKRHCLYPQKNKLDHAGATKFVTTYKQDYKRRESSNVRGESFKPNLKYNPSSTKFNGMTIYQMSYNTFDADTLKKCKRSPVRPSDPRKPIDGHNIPLKKEEIEASKKPKEDKSTETKVDPKVDKMDPSKEEPSFHRKVTTVAMSGHGYQGQDVPLECLTTFQADYKPHPYAPRQPPCIPPASNNHMEIENAKFDGRTTQNIAYQAWPVAPPEIPLWAIKPEYKRPSGGMPFESTYMFDFKSPGSISKVLAIKPSSGNDIIKHAGGDGDSSGRHTTYQVNYLCWSGASPAKTFHQKQVYEPPEQNMEFQSIQRAHFKGEQTERAQLCRKISEHRQVKMDRHMYFNTTYQDTYKDTRPQSGPASFNVPTAFQIRATPVKGKTQEQETPTQKDSFSNKSGGTQGKEAPTQKDSSTDKSGGTQGKDTVSDSGLGMSEGQDQKN